MAADENAATDALVRTLRERYPNVTDEQITGFLAMLDEHVARLTEANRG